MNIVPMTNRDLIKELLDLPLDSVVYIGKGMGPVRAMESTVGRDDGRMYIVVKP